MGRRSIIAYGAVLALVNAGGAMAEPFRILALGDSLTAGYGLAPAEAFPVQLEKALRADGLNVRVINGGVSGDTSAGGLARLDWALSEDRPQAAIVELGANDGLRGLDPRGTFANLDAILTRLEGDGIRVLFTGMLAPPNMGKAFAEQYRQVFVSLAAKHKAALFYPFFLDGVASDPALNQGDGIHPNARGVAVIVGRILPTVKRVLPPAGGKP
jgi:acyl-CoA thioesterase-1